MRIITLLLLFVSLSIQAQVYPIGEPNVPQIINDSLNELRDSTNFDVLRIGGKVNYVTIDSVNGLRYNGNTTVYDDVVSGGGVLGQGAAAPSLRTFKGGILRYAYNFQTANDVSYFEVQIPHKVKLGSAIEAHLHYAPEVNGGVGDTAVFDLETAWANLNGAFASDTIQIKIPMSGKVAMRNYLVNLGYLSGSTAGISDIIACRLVRRQDLDSDTYDGANCFVFIFTVDFHYEVDAMGSNGETSKNTN